MALCLLFISCQDQSRPILHMNEIQVVGSHNSYKKAIDRGLMEILYQEDSNLAITLDYEHLPIAEQLDLGMRNLEIDLFHDPQGGRYKNPLGVRAIENATEFDTAAMVKPGMKVLHVQDIDFRSHYSTFIEALEEIRNWSDDHPEHIPVIVTINLKDEVIEREGFTVPLPFTANALDSVDGEILSVFNRDRLIYPDLVRGSRSSLEQAILTDGWPLLDEVRGKLLFVLDAGMHKNDLYRQDHPTLSGRIMFINVEEGEAEAAFMILNHPIILFNRTQELVGKGYMVRTRSDANTIEARSDDFTRWEKALESGAQVITTDYYKPSRFFESTYTVGFGTDTIFRKNPLRIK